MGLIKKRCWICILKCDLEVRFPNAERKKMIAGTHCCKLIIFIYIYSLANIQEDCLYQVEFDFASIWPAEFWVNS